MDRRQQVINVCDICGRELDRSDDTKDCGGTCLRCMAEVGRDPDCVEAMKEINP